MNKGLESDQRYKYLSFKVFWFTFPFLLIFGSKDVALIRSIDGSKFESLDFTFSSFYDHIQKDYTHNLRYSDGGVLLYTNHLALGDNIIEDKSISPIGQSFSGTQFHFYAPNQNIVYLGSTYRD